MSGKCEGVVGNTLAIAMVRQVLLVSRLQHQTRHGIRGCNACILGNKKATPCMR